MSSLYLIGFIQTLFLSTLIATKKRFQLSDVWLVIFILLMGSRLLFIYLSEIGVYKDNPLLVILEFAYWSLFGPVLFLYITSVTAKTQSFRWVYLYHFIPFITVFLAFSGYIFNTDNVTFSNYNSSGLFFTIGQYTWFFTTHVYFIFCLIKLHQYRSRIKSFFSYKRKVDLKWLLVLTYGFAVFLFYMLTYLLLKSYLNITIPIFGAHLTWFFMVLYIFLIGVFGFRQRDVFISSVQQDGYDNKNVIEHKDSSVRIDSAENLKYAKSKLDSKDAERILKTLQDYMSSEKPYLNCDLDIRMLGQYLGISPHKLSQVINSRLNRNFFEFVNHYRVEYAKQLLKDEAGKHLKIMAIGYDAGFNSKSTFYSVFRKYCNETPAQYRDKIIS